MGRTRSARWEAPAWGWRPVAPSAAALIGGGAIPQPGEVSLAHHGVLFLDEFPEFARPTLEMIRQPLEDGCVTIPRVHSTLKFPAAIMLVAAMNPCPCGYYTDPKRPCKCSPFMVERYLARVSGPLIDRIDIHVEVPPVPWRQLRSESEGMSSAQMREQVISARGVQRRRFAVSSDPEPGTRNPESPQSDPHPENPQSVLRQAQDGLSPSKAAIRNPQLRSSVTTNASMSSRQVRKFCKLDAAGETLLKQAMGELGLSARAHDKVLRIARTIADIEGEQDIAPHHLAEAICTRGILTAAFWGRVRSVA